MQISGKAMRKSKCQMRITQMLIWSLNCGNISRSRVLQRTIKERVLTRSKISNSYHWLIPKSYLVHASALFDHKFVEGMNNKEPTKYISCPQFTISYYISFLLFLSPHKSSTILMKSLNQSVYKHGLNVGPQLLDGSFRARSNCCKWM